MSKGTSRTTPWMVYQGGLDDPFANKNEDPEAKDDDDDDDDDHDSVDSDDETNVVDPIEGVSASVAGKLLTDLDADNQHKKYPRYRLRNLHVDFSSNSNAEEEEEGGSSGRSKSLLFPEAFEGFVDALQSYYRIKTLHLGHGNFGNEKSKKGNGNKKKDNKNQKGTSINGVDPNLRGDDDDIRHLFEAVLSNHLSLQQLTLSGSTLGTQYFKLFTDNFLLDSPDFSFVKLSIHDTPLTTEHCQLLQQMLRRKVRLYELDISNCGLTAGDWNVLAVGIQRNTHVHTVTFIENNNHSAVVVQPTTLLPLLQTPSAVKTLDVQTYQAWSNHSFADFVKALRTNGTLQHVTLRHHGDVDNDDNDETTTSFSLAKVEELLTTHQNVTLESFDLFPVAERDVALHQRVQQLLARNRSGGGGGVGGGADIVVENVGAGASGATTTTNNDKKRGHAAMSK